MTTPKKYTSITRIGVTAEFEAYTTCKGHVDSATFNFPSIRSFVSWVNDHNSNIAYVVVKDPKKTSADLYTNCWPRTFVSPHIKRGCVCQLTVKLDCGAVGQLTFYRSK